MDCAVCGNELLSDRAVFFFFCGVYVHSHCWNKHVLQAHQPEFVIGILDMNGEFKVRPAKEDNETASKE